MAVITMSRQIGSGAEEVAERLAQDLGLRMFDKAMMMRVASEVGIHEAEIVDYSEEEYKARNFFERLFSRQRTIGSVTTRTRGTRGAEEMSTQVLDEARAIDLIRATMRAACERGNVLIIGRGGQAILEDEPGVLHVRVVAPMEDRIARLQGQENLTAPQARRLAAERDRTRAEYLRIFHNINWDDASLYHLVVNTGKAGIDQAVELIVAAGRAMEEATG
jgi:cytidylate kinase